MQDEEYPSLVKSHRKEGERHREEAMFFWVSTTVLVLVTALNLAGLVQEDGGMLLIKVITALTAGMAVAYLSGLFAVSSPANSLKSRVAMRTAGALTALLIIAFFHPAQARESFSELLSFTK